MKDARKLAAFLADWSEKPWDEFIIAEHDKSYSTSESVVFSLIRGCAMQNLAAIKMAISRMDGKVETPVQLIMPKVFYLFPHAKSVMEPIIIEGPKSKEIVVFTEDEMKPVPPSKGFRDAMSRMVDAPRSVPQDIIKMQEQVEKFVRGQGRAPKHIPRVKSVVVAHALQMAQSRNMDAVNEVFDQLDGKLVEKIRVVGDDMYLTSFSSTAPEGAVLNEDGVYMIEATKVQEMWRKNLGGEKVQAIIEE